MRAGPAIVLLLLCQGRALADFRTSLAPQAVASYLDEGAHAILIVPAGSGSRAAASAIARALEFAGRGHRLLGVALPSLTGRADADIVRALSHLPWTRLGLVRVAPGPPGEPDTAQVTFLTREGGVVGAFTIEDGSDLPERAELGNEPRAPHPYAQKEYSRRHISFPDASGSGWSTPYEGRRRALSPEEFYSKIERPDLAARYRTRRAGKVALLATGGVLMGLAILGGGISIGIDSDRGPLPGTIILGAGLAAGLALTLGGGFLNPHPVSAARARDMASSFNRRLRHSLGL